MREESMTTWKMLSRRFAKSGPKFDFGVRRLMGHRQEYLDHLRRHDLFVPSSLVDKIEALRRPKNGAGGGGSRRAGRS